MKLIYRLGLIIAGCVFAGVVRDATQRVLYWVGRPDALRGLLPYLIPIFFGYVYALDAKSHWSQDRLKNDVMAYVGSTLLVGHPLLFTLSFWHSGGNGDPASLKISIASNVLLLANLAIAVLVWRSAIRRGFPLSSPWGGVSGGVKAGESGETAAEAQKVEAAVEGAAPETVPQAETTTEEAQDRQEKPQS